MQQEEKQQAARKKTIAAELEWVRSNPKARQAKSKARLKRFEELNSQEYQKRAETNEIFIPSGERLGDLVIEADQISKRFDDRILFENVSFNIPRGAIVGVIGGNGAGKSTLLKMIVGKETADDGILRVGDSVQLSYVDQLRDDLQGENTVWQEISDGQDIITVGSHTMQSPSVCAAG